MSKTIIFDFDGTLADSLDVIVEIFEQLTGKGGELSRAEMAGLRHMPIPVVAKRLGIPLWRVPWLLWRGRNMMGKYIQQVPPYAGIEAAVRDLHAEGYRLLIVSSNSRRNVRTFLKQYGLEQYFTHVYGGIGLFDKARELRGILARNRVQVRECVYVGDETRDVEASQALGLRCIAVEWGFADPLFLMSRKPTALAARPAELVPIVNKLLGKPRKRSHRPWKE